VVTLYTCMLLYWGFNSRRPLYGSTSYVTLNNVLSVYGKCNRIRTEAILHFKLGQIIFICWNFPRKSTKTSFAIVFFRDAHSPGARSPWQLNYVRWPLIFVGTQCGTFFMLPSWRLEFWGGCQMFGKCCAFLLFYLIFSSGTSRICVSGIS